MSNLTIGSPPLWHLVEESLMEAEFLWTRLDDKLDAHDHTLAEVEAWVECRLLGALDGVQLAGASAIEPLLADALQQRDLGLVSAAAYVLAVLADPRADRALEAALREVSAYRAPAFARGLGRAGRVPALHALWARTQDAPAIARAVVLEALSFCGEAPRADYTALLEDPDASLRNAAASALRFVPAALLDTYAQLALDSKDTGVRNRAIAAGVAAGNAHCWRSCLRHVKAPDPDSGPLLLLAGLLGSAREVGWLIDTLKEPALCRDALWALGFAGTASAVEACLTQMEAGPHAAVACEAISAITGLDLHEAKLVGRSNSQQSTDTDDLDAVLVPTADELLPAPDVAGIQQWWAHQRARFDPAVHYFGGDPKTIGTLRHALEHGATRRRHAIALEFAARSGGACVVQTLGFCRDQRRQLARASALAPSARRDATRAPAFPQLAEG